MQPYPKSRQLRQYSRKNRKIKLSTADKWFSKFIRLRDSLLGWCICITCNRPYRWKELDCGHFQTRDHPMTRFNEQNCNAQCRMCNNWKKGEQYRYGKAIDIKYGYGTASKLEALAKIRGQKVHTTLALKDIAKEYRLKTKEMAKEKGIEL